MEPLSSQLNMLDPDAIWNALPLAATTTNVKADELLWRMVVIGTLLDLDQRLRALQGQRPRDNNLDLGRATVDTLLRQFES